VGFGVTHVFFGFSVLVAERREEREQAFWAAVEQINPYSPDGLHKPEAASYSSAA